MQVRNFQPSDIDFALKSMLKEGWLYNRVEIERMLGMDPEGSFLCEEDGPLGFITCVTYRRTGVIGHLIVSEQARGRKIGQELVRRAVDYASARGMRSILLFATDQGARVYGREGFRTIAKVMCLQVEKTRPMEIPECSGLSQVEEEDMDRIEAIDATLFGDARSGLLAGLRRDYPDLCFKIERAGRILGYAFGRTTSSANDFGPWVCLTGLESDARALHGSVLSRFDNRSVFMGVFSQNRDAVDTIPGLKVLRTWDADLMVRGEPRYVSDRERVLSLVGFELG